MMIGWSFASRKPARRGQGGSARVGVAGWGDGGVRCGCGLGARGGGALTAVGLCLVVGRCRLHRAGAAGGRRPSPLANLGPQRELEVVGSRSIRSILDPRLARSSTPARWAPTIGPHRRQSPHARGTAGRTLEVSTWSKGGFAETTKVYAVQRPGTN